MKNLETTYMGLKLKSPIVVASSGLTNSLENLIEMERYGSGAVVLKSLFEEEIEIEMNRNLLDMSRPGTLYPEIFDFFDYATVDDTVSKYLYLIKKAKENISIPVIASVNCVSSSEWTHFAKRFEDAGADALELNVFVMPSDLNRTGEENEKVYFEVFENVRNEVSIPIALKISYYFSNLASMIKKLSETGVSALVLFNRFFSPDIDIETYKIIPSSLYSTPNDLPISLRWIAMMSGRVKCDLAASTGIHDGKALIKQLLAGAKVCQIASTLYKNGIQRIQSMLDELDGWMDKNEFNCIDDFRGMCNQANISNPALYERSQFMKHFSQKF